MTTPPAHAPTDPPVPRVRRVGPEDWASHRALRLDMLEADPDAFWADPAEARARTEQDWRDELAGPRIHLQAVRAEQEPGGEQEPGAQHALGGEEVLGGIALLPTGYTPEHPIPADRAHIVSLWVRPTGRGRGVSRLLLAELARIALELGRPDLRLDVDDTNLPARRLYARLGFVETGQREPRESRGTQWVEYAIRAEELLAQE